MADEQGKNDVRCSFCGESYHDVGPLIEGPASVYICQGCIDACIAEFASPTGMPTDVACSFCRKRHVSIRSKSEANASICEECTDLVRTVLEQEVKRRGE